MSEIRQKIINQNVTLNALYLNEDQEILNNIIELVTDIFDEDHDENIIKIVSLNKVLKKWRLNDHPETINDIERMIRNNQHILQNFDENKKDYTCICGRKLHGISLLLPYAYPGVYSDVEPDCAKEITYMINEILG